MRKVSFKKVVIENKFEFRMSYMRNESVMISKFLKFVIELDFQEKVDVFLTFFKLAVCSELQSIYPQEFADKNLDYISYLKQFLSEEIEVENVQLFYKDILEKRIIKDKLLNFPQGIFYRFNKRICNHLIKEDIPIFKNYNYLKFKKEYGKVY